MRWKETTWKGDSLATAASSSQLRTSVDSPASDNTGMLAEDRSLCHADLQPRAAEHRLAGHDPRLACRVFQELGRPIHFEQCFLKDIATHYIECMLSDP